MGNRARIAKRAPWTNHSVTGCDHRSAKSKYQMRVLSLLLFLFTVSSSLPAETLTINDPKDGWLNLRSGPGTSFRIIQRMNNGMRVNELERQGNWSNVALPNGVIGWVYRKYMLAGSSTSQSFGVSSDSWLYADGKAVWDLNRNGKAMEPVFLGYYFDTRGYYYGLRRVSNDPLIHFMGVKVIHSGGRENELEASQCYEQSCIKHLRLAASWAQRFIFR